LAEVEVFILMLTLMHIRVFLMHKVTLMHIRVFLMRIRVSLMHKVTLIHIRVMVMHIQTQDIMDNRIPRPMPGFPMLHMHHVGLEEDSGVAVVEVVGSAVGGGDSQ